MHDAQESYNAKCPKNIVVSNVGFVVVIKLRFKVTMGILKRFAKHRAMVVLYIEPMTALGQTCIYYDTAIRMRTAGNSW